MATNTTNYNFTLPSVNSPTDENLWGGQLNGNWSALDNLLKVATNNVTVALSGNTILDATSQNKLILCNATSAGFTVTLLPAATAGSGFMLAIKKTDSGANTVTVQANAAENIDQANTYVLSAQDNAIIIISDGTQWWLTTMPAPSVSTATSSTLGIVKPDNSTITVSGGVITAAKQNLTLGSISSFNSATTYAVTGIPAGIKELSVSLAGVTVSANSNILFQIGDATGGLKTSGYAGAGTSTNSSSVSSQFTAGIGAVYSAGSPTMSGTITFRLIDATNFIWVANYTFAGSAGSLYGGGYVTLSGPLDRMTFTTIGGTATWNAGKINDAYF